MIHINNQHICTSCGIVASEFTPKDQVLTEIQNKLAKVKVNSPQREEYYSPVALAQIAQSQAARPNQLNNQHPQRVVNDKVFPEDATLDKILAQLGHQSGMQGQPTAYVGSAVQAPDIAPSKQYIPRNPQASEQPQNLDFIEGNGEYINNVVSEKVIQGQTEVVEKEPPKLTPEEMTEISKQPEEVQSVAEEVYPSHQVNPILIKIFVIVFAALLMFVIGYFLSTNAKFKNFVNLIKNAGQIPNEN